jgi:beta-lactamase superfamily II metal-dependent hydrolase
VIRIIACWLAVLGALSSAACAPPAADDGEPCGGGTWQRGALELHHLDVGQADATLIVGPTGRSLLVDAGEPRWDGAAGAEEIGRRVREVLGCARIDQVLLTHFHVDHVGFPGQGGLWHLAEVQGLRVGMTLHRDVRRFRGDGGSTIDRWAAYLDGPGQALGPRLAREGRGQLDLGREVDVRIVSVDGHGAIRPGDFRADRAPPNENDYSIALVLRFGRFDYFLGGDLSGELSASPFGYAHHDVESAVARGLPDVDVYRVNHHGSDHSSNATLLAQLDPEVSIVSVGADNRHGHPRQATVDRLSGTSVLHLTQRGSAGVRLGEARVGGTVVVRTFDGLTYTVGGERHRATDPPRVDADGDGYFREADPDDMAAQVLPGPRGGCDPLYQQCSD